LETDHGDLIAIDGSSVDSLKWGATHQMGVSAGVDASRVDVEVLEETNLEALTIRLDVDIGTFSSVDLSGLNRACSLATDRDGGTGAWCDTDFSGVDDSWSVIV